MKKKFIIIIIICLINVLMCSTLVFASDISSDADEFIREGANGKGTGGDTSEMKTAIGDIAGVLTGLSIIAAVVVAAMLGIQFMIGSLEQQAKVKQAIIPYIVGCIVVFGALGIWRLVVGALNGTV